MTFDEEISILKNTDKRKFLSHSSDKPDDYHFVKSNNDFTKKARLLQAIRRFQSGAECGYFKKEGVIYYHPNLAENGDKNGLNFLQKEIFEYAKERIANKKNYETIQRNRLFNNFLSSQPMAFNLFFPLIGIKEKEGRVLAESITPLIDNEGKLGIDSIKEVGIEFIPEYYKECLNDKTAMDAYFRYSTKEGKNGIIAIETKYTDILGKNEAKDPSLAINTTTQRTGISQLFTEEAKERISSTNDERRIKLSQVYRNFLLTETVRLYENLDDSISIVLSPKENTSNKNDEEELHNALTDEYKYKFQVVSLESFVDAIINAFPDKTIFQDFKHRYLDFRLAEWLLKNK